MKRSEALSLKEAMLDAERDLRSILRRSQKARDTMAIVLRRNPEIDSATRQATQDEINKLDRLISYTQHALLSLPDELAERCTAIQEAMGVIAELAGD